MIAMTTSNSISVKARFIGRVAGFMECRYRHHEPTSSRHSNT
jgi:hypothetical protein